MQTKKVKEIEKEKSKGREKTYFYKAFTISLSAKRTQQWLKSIGG